MTLHVRALALALPLAVASALPADAAGIASVFRGRIPCVEQDGAVRVPALPALPAPETGSAGPCRLPGGSGGCRTIGLVQGPR